MEKFTLGASILLSLQLSAYTPKIEKEISTTLSSISEKYTSPLDKFLPKTLFVGDSWTVGYTTGLKNVKVSAQVGKSSSWVLEHFTDSLTDEREYVVILCGINNADNPAQVISDILEMMIMAREHKKKYVVCTLWQGQMYKTKDPQKIQKNIEFINKTIRFFLERSGQLVDLDKEISDPNTGKIKAEYDSGDHLHINGKGQKKVKQLIAEGLEKYE